MLTGFVLGLLAGWLVEWLFFTFFWKNKNEKKQKPVPLASKDGDINRLENELKNLKSQLVSVNGEKSTAQTKLSGALTRVETLKNKVNDLETALQDSQSMTEEQPLGAAEEPEASEELPNVAAVSTDIEVDQSDDLTKLSGIGPKLAEGLNGCGITKYDHLIIADLDGLLEELKNKGVRFNKNNAESWAKQATLAAQGDWDGLKSLAI